MGFGGPGWMEMLIVGCIALLLFGKRLPSVAQSLGKSIGEFQNGLKGVKDEVRSTTGIDSLTAPIDEIRDEITK